MADFIGVFTALGFLFSFIWLFNDWVYDGKITTTCKRMKNRNLMYQCTRCDRLHREYQRDLVHAAKGYEACPHCDQSGYGLSAVNKPDKWMDSHQDCAKFSLLRYFKIMRAMKTISRLKKEREEIERFERYNNLEANVDWIMKLQKDLSK